MSNMLNMTGHGLPLECSIYVCRGCGAYIHWPASYPDGPGPCTVAFGDQLPCGGAYRLVIAAASEYLTAMRSRVSR